MSNLIQQTLRAKDLVQVWDKDHRPPTLTALRPVLATAAVTASSGLYVTSQVLIRTANDGLLFAVDGGGIGGNGALRTDATTVGEYEIFTMVDTQDDSFALQTSGGFYLTAVNGGGVGENADGNPEAILTDGQSGDAETLFTLFYTGPNTFFIQTSDGQHFLTASNGGGVGADDPDAAITSTARSATAQGQFRLRIHEVMFSKPRNGP